MCGVVGIVAPTSEHLGYEIYEAMQVLQHRGQDAAGILTWDGNDLHTRKGSGLIRDVFSQEDIQRLQGFVGIGHNRYPTAGNQDESMAQPMLVNAPMRIALAHNGNLTNRLQLIRELQDRDMRTSSDSDALLNVYAAELTRLLQRQQNAAASYGVFFEAVVQTIARCHGAYSVAMVIEGVGLMGFRDANGIRPLLLGHRQRQGTDEYMLASENVSLAALGFEFVRDLKPGEAVLVDKDGNLHERLCIQEERPPSPCLFEYIYLARPDSILDSISVYRARLSLGQSLAEKILSLYPDHGIDVVIPIPESSTPAAMQLASTLGVSYREGFIKNRYVGRTFIMPNQRERRAAVRRKLSTLSIEFANRRVLLVDDSIVRGTTSLEVVRMAREAQAREVWFASAAPPIRYPNVYGIDMPSMNELIAHSLDEEQIRKRIGADVLVYQDIETTLESCLAQNPKITTLEDSVFTGKYLTADVDQEYLLRLQRERGNNESEIQAELFPGVGS